MSLVSFTPLTDGSTATAAGVNTPLSTIYNDYNGNITNANISSSAAIAQSKLSLALTGAAYGHVDTSEATTSTSYAQLTTKTDTVTVTIGASGMALVSYGMNIAAAASTNRSFAAVAMTGANVETAGTNGNRNIEYTAVDNGFSTLGDSYLVTGLTAGSTTFTLWYKVNTGTGTFAFRHISVIPL